MSDPKTVPPLDEWDEGEWADETLGMAEWLDEPLECGLENPDYCESCM